jgi:hypothetical protein
MVQIEVFGEGTFGNAKAADGIPASDNFDVDNVGQSVFLGVPLRTLEGTLVSIPDTGEPFACFFLLQNAKLADHSREATAGEAAAGEAKQKELIAFGVVIDKEVVG